MITTPKTDMQIQQDDFAALLNSASQTDCMCRFVTAKSLVDAAKNGCLKCCSKHIAQAEQTVDRTTALTKAISKDHTKIVELLLPLERRLKQHDVNMVFKLAAERGKEMLDVALKILAPEFFKTLLEMREIRCSCEWPARNIREAVEYHCMRCCSKRIGDCVEFICATIDETNAAEDPCLASVTLMTFLQTHLNINTHFTKRMYAARNNLYDTALLIEEQGDQKDINGRKASDYAASVHNPKLWALFPDDISPEYVADLEAAHSAECVCKGKSKSLSGAIDNKCLRCCVCYIWEAAQVEPQPTVLMQAALGSDVGIVRLLMHRQAGCRDKNSVSVMMHTAEAGNLATIEALVEKEAGLKDKTGQTALMYAAKGGRLHVVKHLLQFEAGIQDGLGRTALIHAILNSRLEIARELLPLEGGVKDNRGRGPEHYAFHTGDLEIWRLFNHAITPEEGAQRHQEALSQCICDDQAENLIQAVMQSCFCCCAKYKEQAGQLVNENTALMVAAGMGDVAIMSLLLEKEAGMQNELKETALITAIQARQRVSVQLLLPSECGLCDWRGVPACTYAAWVGDEGILQQILDKIDTGIFRSIQNARKSPCVCKEISQNLNSAVESNCLRCASTRLYQVGKDRAALPIALSAVRGNADIVALLMPFEAGIKPTSRATALDHAALNWNRACFDLLRRSPEQRDMSGIPAHMFDFYNGDLQAVRKRKDECESIYKPGTNHLDFALLAGRPRLIRVVTRGPDERRQFAKSENRVVQDKRSMVSRLLQSPSSQRHFRDILHLVCCSTRMDRASLIFTALFWHPGDAVRLLRPFCTPERSWITHATKESCTRRTVLAGVTAMKNSGVIEGIEDLFSEDQLAPNGSRTYLAANPLRQKQLQLARMQTQKARGVNTSVGNKRSFAWLETEAESSFNRFVLLEARDLWWKTLSAMELNLPDRKRGVSRKKLSTNAAVIMGAYLFLYGKVREMLDE